MKIITQSFDGEWEVKKVIVGSNLVGVRYNNIIFNKDDWDYILHSPHGFDYFKKLRNGFYPNDMEKELLQQ